MKNKELEFGDFVFASDVSGEVFYGIYYDKGKCWRNTGKGYDLTEENLVSFYHADLARGGFGGNWFEKMAETIVPGSEVWVSDYDYGTAMRGNRILYIVAEKLEKGYRCILPDYVKGYNEGWAGTVHWMVAVPTGNRVTLVDHSVKKEELPVMFKKGDRVLCVQGNSDVDKGEIYEVLKDADKNSSFVKVLTPKGGKNCFTFRFKKVESKVVPEWYEPKFQPGDLVECVEGNTEVNKGGFYEIVESFPHKGTGTRFVKIKRPDGIEFKVYERRFVLVPEGDKWSFEITNGLQVNGPEIAENLTRKKPIIYHTGVAEDKAFFEIHNSFIFKWQQLDDLWDEAHEYLTFVKDHETYCTYVTDLSNIDSLLRIFRAVNKRPWPADGSGRRKVEVFQPTL